MKKRIFLCLSSVLLLATGCVDESSFTLDSTGKTQTEGLMLSLGVSIPTEYEPVTYGMNAALECRIDSIDVLGFKVSDNTLLFHKRIGDITATANDNKKTFKVTVPYDGTNANVYIMLVANASHEVDSAAIEVGVSTADKAIKAITINRFTSLSSGNGSGKWTVPAEPYRPFPMWGQTGTINLAAEAVSIPDVTLLRCLARVDVGVNYDATDTGQGLGSDKKLFVLKSVHLCNTSKQIQVIPTLANLVASRDTVKSPSVPDEGGVYSQIDYAPTASQTLEYNNEIYMAEHAKGEEGEHSTNPCIIIGAQYNGSATTTYYRVDFAKVSGNDVTYLDVLRNHRYRVNILGVNAAGKESIDAALSGSGNNLVVDVECTDNNIINISYDGQYLLGTSVDSIITSNTAKTLSFSVKNTNPNAWSATSTGSWINNISGSTTLTFKVDANSTENTRVDTIKIKAGNLENKVVVKQRATEDFSITPSSWYYMDGSSNVLTVTSSFDWAVRVSTDQYNILTSYDKSGVSGSTSFNFSLINDMTDIRYDNKATVLTFYSPKGEFEDKSVTITGRSSVSSLIYEGKVEGIAVLNVDSVDGTGWTSGVKRYDARAYNNGELVENTSIRTLTATLISSINAGTPTFEKNIVLTNDKFESEIIVVIDGIQTAYGSNAYTQTATITMPQYRGGEAIDIRIRFNGATGANDSVFVNAKSSHDGWAGSNIYWDGEKFTFDDVGETTNENYQGVFFKWGGLWGITPAGTTWGTDSIVYVSDGIGGHTKTKGYAWESIPWSNPGTITPNRFQKYITEIAHGDSIANGIGDICKYLGVVHNKKWRLPTSNEFGKSATTHNYTNPHCSLSAANFLVLNIAVFVRGLWVPHKFSSFKRFMFQF